MSGLLSSRIHENGGAVAVAAGNNFCLALTLNGRVLVWGKVPGGELHSDSSSHMLGADIPMTVGECHQSA